MIAFHLSRGHVLRRPINQNVLLVGVTAVAVVLRMHHLGQWSFWVDELNTVLFAQNFPQEFANDPTRAAMIHPITSILIYWSTQLFGVSEWSTRLAPALIGAASIPILYFPIRKIYGERTALVFSILLAVSPWHLYWSQNARFYVMLLLLYTLAIIAFNTAMEQNRPRFVILFLILLGLTATERLIGFFLVPTVTLYLLSLKLFRFEMPPGANWKNLSILIIPGSIVLLIGGWEFLREPAIWIDKFFGQLERGPLDILMQYLRGIDYQILIVGGVGVIFLLFYKRHRTSLLFAIAALVPLLGTMAASLLQFSQGRYTFVSLTSWLILASVTIVTLSKRVIGWKAQWMLLATLIALFVMVPIDEMTGYYSDLHGGRPCWREAFLFVQEYRKSDEMIISNDPTSAYYYLDQEIVQDMEEIIPAIELSQLDMSDERIWFVVAGNTQMDENLKQWMEENSEIVYFDGQKTKVYLYDPTFEAVLP